MSWRSGVGACRPAGRAGDLCRLAADGAPVVDALKQFLDLLGTKVRIDAQRREHLVDALHVGLVRREVALCRLRASCGFLNHVGHPHSFRDLAPVRKVMHDFMRTDRLPHRNPWHAHERDLHHVMAHA
jgi:hypothetical protein